MRSLRPRVPPGVCPWRRAKTFILCATFAVAAVAAAGAAVVGDVGGGGVTVTLDIAWLKPLLESPNGGQSTML